jgi:polysaccharide biosynthesis/export protein
MTVCETRSKLFGMSGCMLLLLGSTPLAAATADRLGAGDTVRVTVFQSPELTTEGQISSVGTLTFPLLGEVAIADHTPTEAGLLVAKRLREGRFVVNPQVSVSLLELRSHRVSVLGQVARPGSYPLDSSTRTLSAMLAQAGGVTTSGDDTVIVMRRHGNDTERLAVDVPAMYRSGDVTSDLELQNGDTVFVPNAPVFYIYGAVQRPGMYRLESDTSVLSALSLGGGLAPRGTERGVTIHRPMSDGSIAEIHAALADRVEPNDIVRVKQSVF